MGAWIRSWSRLTWGMAWAMTAASIVGAVYLFGPSTVAGWIGRLLDATLRTGG